VRAVDGDLGDALGQLYVEHRFAPETRAAAKAMLDDLEATLRDVLWKSTWMSESTRREAVAKLDAISARVGYPEKWRTYSTVAIDRNAYATDAIRLALYRARHTFGGIARTQDHALWSMSAATINASYTAGSNEVTIPAGILQPPLFAPHGDDAANYGALGAIMGHELIHAFDDQGHRTDGSGLLRDWWQTSDERAFALHAACFEREYDRLGVIGNEHEDGALVVGEALADFGGARLAYRAFERAAAGKPRRIINGWTPEQRFFLAFARAHAALERPERARLDLADDPHATGRNRVIGTLSQMPEFAAAFHCAARAPMVTPPGERCSLF
jgi:putative endopeptidase